SAFLSRAPGSRTEDAGDEPASSRRQGGSGPALAEGSVARETVQSRYSFILVRYDQCGRGERNTTLSGSIGRGVLHIRGRRSRGSLAHGYSVSAFQAVEGMDQCLTAKRSK